MGMGMGEICSAINEIDGKKQNLRESLKRLESIGGSSSCIDLKLKWEGLDSYFKTLESSLQTKFNLLLLHNQSSSSSSLSSSSPRQQQQQQDDAASTTTAAANAELKRLCENSDGLGLKQYIISVSPAAAADILDEAFTRYAPHTAPAMVLHAISSSLDDDDDDGADQFHPSSPLIIMLQALIRYMQSQPPPASDNNIEFEDKAMQIALHLRTATTSSSSSSLGFLLLVTAYGLTHRFTVHDLIHSFFILAQTHPSHAIRLSPQVLSPNHINDLIQKLIDKQMHITAVNFSIQLHKTRHFPPVRLLEECKLMSITAIQEAQENHQSSNEVMLREIDTLKAIIKCIDENHLQSEYPKDSVVELVTKLENEVENAKQHLVKRLTNNPGSKRRTVRARVSKQKLLSKPKKPKQNKFLQTGTSTQNVMPVEEPRSQASDLLPDHIDQYHSSSCGSDPAAPYTGPFASPCELARTNSGHSGNLMPVDNETGFFVSQSHLPSSYNSNGWISE